MLPVSIFRFGRLVSHVPLYLYGKSMALDDGAIGPEALWRSTMVLCFGNQDLRRSYLHVIRDQFSLRLSSKI
jgi:hypothetical protein